jgi:DNA-directed RNA polymerase specialized sigma24 family protein
MSGKRSSVEETREGGIFATTRWSLVMAAGGENARGREALESLCRTYWFPVYALVRRRGEEPDSARDFTQEFFAEMLSRRTFSTARREIGRFRSFVAQCLRNFLNDQWDRSQAQKRGGGLTILSLDAESAEGRYQEAAYCESPELLFDRQWAQEILGVARQRLVEELEASGRGVLLGVMDRQGSPDAPGLDAEAERMGIPVNTLKSQMHRARHRHAAIIRELVAETVSSPLDVEDELRHLFRVMSVS